MVQKIKAAVDARHDQSLQIIARTDAYAIEGLERALERAHAYVAAGADATFVEAPTSLRNSPASPEHSACRKSPTSCSAARRQTPAATSLPNSASPIVLYANAALQAALKASYDVLSVLKTEGSLKSVADRLASFEERQRAVAKDEWDAREARYRV